MHHVRLVTGDVGAALEFYRDVLGLSPVEEAAGGVGGGGSLLLRAGAASGGFLVVEASEGLERGRPGIGGVHHVALGTAGEEEILMWKRRLDDAGVSVTGPYDRGYFTSIYFRDPDGQILEIATAGPGYTYDEPLESLGERLVLPPNRIVRGYRDEASIRALTHAEPVPEITEGMRVTGIHHVSGITDDLDMTGALLEQGLGMRLVKRTTNRDDPSQLHYFWAGERGGHLADHGTMTLFGWPPGWNVTRAGIGQTSAVGFDAGGEDLANWTEHLGRHGFRVEEPAEDPFFTVVRLRSHDGMGIELVASARDRHESASVDRPQSR